MAAVAAGTAAAALAGSFKLDVGDLRTEHTRACPSMVLERGVLGGEYLSCSGDAVGLLVALENLAADSPIRFDVDVEAEKLQR